MDLFDLYEHCVQSPAHVVKFLRAAHGQEPLVLREDFCGGAAVSRRWAMEAIKRGDDARAVGIDLDGGAIRAGLARCDAEQARRVRLERGDCIRGEVPFADEGADVIFVGNYSLGYIFDRATLIEYMRASRGRLARGNCGFGGGIFACDTYGGAGAFTLGAIRRKHTGPRGEIIHYLWRHDRADPLTSIVENSMSFRVERDGEIVAEHTDAFTYRWRLWSIAELREALAEAGFASTEVYTEINLAPDEPVHPVNDPAELGENWSVLIVARG